MIGPDSDFADPSAGRAGRNVFANNSFEGLDIEGAGNSVVLGNYFGVDPDGVTDRANRPTSRSPIDRAPGFEATGSEVGVTVEGAATASARVRRWLQRDRWRGLAAGIDLDGERLQDEAPATGPTNIHGNFVGLTANGTTRSRERGRFEVIVGGAERGGRRRSRR